tara:strand:- start:307 stop:693 length:387 start_codon:yes stop_codon:yes gene_type:complete
MRYAVPLILLLLAGCNGQPDHPGYDRADVDVSGKKIGNLDSFDGGSLEQFREDGRWIHVRRGSVDMKGSWTQDSLGRICVVTLDDGEEASWLDRDLCRHLYRKDDAFYIEVMMSGGKETGDLQRVEVR